MAAPHTILDHIENTLKALPLHGTPDELYAPMRYILTLGGKRFRPLLVVLAGGMYGAAEDTLLGGAAAVEIFHNFSLMHDDIMDQAPLRRGQPTVHHVWNIPTAILAGDGMLVKVYEVLLGAVAPHLLPEVLTRFNRTALEVVEGQQLDMNFEGRNDVTEAEYLEMIRLKTAVLVGFSLWLGARLGGASAAEAQELYLAGERMGIGFQLYDDYLDTFGDPALTGKQPGGDIRVSKKTWLLIHTLQHVAEGQKHEALAWLHDKTPARANNKVAAITALMAQAGAHSACQQISEAYYQQGLHKVKDLGTVPSYRTAIEELAGKLMQRTS